MGRTFFEWIADVTKGVIPVILALIFRINERAIHNLFSSRARPGQPEQVNNPAKCCCNSTEGGCHDVKDHDA